MTSPVTIAATMAVLLTAGHAAAQSNVVKVGVAQYTTNSRTNGISGIGVPPGADVETGDATTLILEYERLLTPHLGIELAIGIPPRIEARATGSVAFLGDDVFSARSVSPVIGLTWHFGEPGDKWRPYAGMGLNYTKFIDIESRLASDVEIEDSVGWAVKAGVEYSISPRWGLFASVTAMDVKSKIVASGATVLQSTIDFRPVVYALGAAYRF